jgi:hypothetical protein
MDDLKPRGRNEDKVKKNCPAQFPGHMLLSSRTTEAGNCLSAM